MGVTPTARLKRSKKADLDRAASRANCATLQGAEGCACMRRSASANLGSDKPRTKPGDAAVQVLERRASIKSTSSRRAITMSRAGRSVRVSSRSSWTSVDKRGSPRACTHCGSSGSSKAASGEPSHAIANQHAHVHHALWVAHARTTFDGRNRRGDNFARARWQPVHAGGCKTTSRRNEREVASIQGDCVALCWSVYCQMAAAVQHCEVERAAHFRCGARPTVTTLPPS